MVPKYMYAAIYTVGSNYIIVSLSNLVCQMKEMKVNTENGRQI